MARSNGIDLADAGSRKKLMKPVLPALPLIPKTKKNLSHPKEEEQPSVINPAPAPTPAPPVHGDEPEDDTQIAGQTALPKLGIEPSDRSSITISEPEATVAVEPGASSQPATSDNAIVSDEHKKHELITSSSGSSEFDGKEALETVPGNSASTATSASYENPQASTALGQQSPLASNHVIEDNLNVDLGRKEISSTGDDLARPSVQQFETNGSTSYGQAETPSTEVEKSDAEAPAPAPAPVEIEKDQGISTNVVANSSSAQHSAHPSVDTFSMQQTSTNLSGLPAAPDSIGSSQPRVLSNGVPYNHSQPYVNGHISPASNGAMVSAPGPPNFPTILDHIHRILYSQEWVDCEICVYLPQEVKPTILRNAHSFVLIRSARIRNIIHQQRASGYSYYYVNLYPSKAIDANAFDAALRFFYDDSVLSTESILRPDALLDKASRAGALDYIMSYMVSGLELGIEPVIAQSLGFIARLLDWDIAELAIRCASMLKSASGPAVNPHAPQDAFFAAKAIINHVFGLIVLRLDMKKFRLDVEAVPLELMSRLAPFEASRAAVNPALANMVFGSMPASSDMPPISPPTLPTPNTTRAETIASSIMLNVDFEDLRDLNQWLKKVHGENGVRVINEVIEERERRRLSILSNRSTSNKQRMANSTAWDIIGLREYVNEDALRRERVGFLLPGKRGGHN